MRAAWAYLQCARLLLRCVKATLDAKFNVEVRLEAAHKKADGVAETIGAKEKDCALAIRLEAALLGLILCHQSVVANATVTHT